MEILSWLCLSLSQLLKLPWMASLGSSTVIRQGPGLPRAPSSSEVSLRAELLP